MSGKTNFFELIRAIFFLALIVTSQTSAAVSTKINLPYSDMAEKAKVLGTIPVIIKLKTRNIQGTLSAASIDVNKAKLLKSLNKYNSSKIKEFRHLPITAMEIDSGGLQELLSNPDVAAIYEDKPLPTSLIDSTEIIGATSTTNSGAGGNGQVVAILDTGVDSNHPFLTGKVINEACFSKTTSSATSLCPNGNNTQTGSGAAQPCTGLCNHGTHVAGIVAGKGTNFSGVAPEASLMAVQVFSKFDAGSCSGGTPCVLAYTSDLISGLEYVYSQRNNYNIAAVNLSLGGGSYTGTCDNDPVKEAIDLLRSANIATIIASGNNGYTDAINSPACVSSAISVGATKKNDEIASYSNSSSILDILAPGSGIQSSIPGTGYGWMSGTSMATPHVAGAFAVLRAQKPSSTVDEILNTLKTSGFNITDPRNNIAKSRVRLDKALLSLVPPKHIRNDFNLDGKADILWRNSITGENKLSQMAGASIASTNLINQISDPEWEISGTGDLDGDGDTDILWRHKISGANWIYLMNSSSISNQFPLNTVADTDWKIAGIGDLDGNGTDDIIWHHTTSGANWVYLMENGNIINSLYINTVPDTNWKIAGIADFDNDSNVDILWRHATLGYNWIFLMKGAQVKNSMPVAAVTDLSWKIAQVGDINGDGNADILWRNAFTGLTWEYLMNGGSVVTSSPVAGVSTQWKISQLNDFNGDNKADILWRNESSGANWIYIMNASNILQSSGIQLLDPQWAIANP